MNPLSILFGYFGRQFLFWFCLLMTVLLVIVFVIDTLELLRRASGKDVPLDVVLRMGLYKLPSIGQKIVPFAVLFSAMFTFWRLTRSNELVVARAVGVSVWQFLTPVIMAALLIGVLRVTVINPLGASVIAEFERLEQIYLKRRTEAFDISQSGLWLRQSGGDRTYLIHAQSIREDTLDLQDVVVFRYQEDDVYDVRLDAVSARLEPGYWVIKDAIMRVLNQDPRPVPAYRIPTQLTRDKIAESFADPSSISFWGLPRFIETLEATGFSAIRHRLHFQSLLAQPLVYCAMVLLAAAFSLRQTRRGGTLMMVTGGVITGLTLFVLTDIILSLGSSEAIPIVMAAWTPAGVSLLLGTTVLLHLEDG